MKQNGNMSWSLGNSQPVLTARNTKIRRLSIKKAGSGKKDKGVVGQPLAVIISLKDLIKYFH